MVTIKDIARESGYSVSTVSRVLNERRDVSPGAKKRIEEVVAHYNFIPNNNAKHLKQNFSKTIVLLVKGTSNMLFADIVEKIQHKMEGTEYIPVVSYLDELDHEVLQALQICGERKPMGLLFLGGNPQHFVECFKKVEVPSVIVTNCAPQLKFDNLSSVATDDITAAECMMDYLIGQGHRKIGIISGDQKSSYTSSQRYAGCQRSFSKHQIDFHEAMYFAEAKFSFESAYDALLELLKKAADMTAVYTMGDVMAVGAIRALKDQGYDVPGDISVTGFDGIKLADYYNPKLATVRQQHKELAERCVDILFDMIQGRISAVHEIIPFELVLGESVRERIPCHPKLLDGAAKECTIQKISRAGEEL